MGRGWGNEIGCQRKLAVCKTLNCTHDSSQCSPLQHAFGLRRGACLSGAGLAVVAAELPLPAGGACWHGCFMPWCWPLARQGTRRVSDLRLPCRSRPGWLRGVHAIESQLLFPQLQTRRALCALGAAAVLLALFFPGSALHPTRFGLAAAALGAGHCLLWPVWRGRGTCLVHDACRRPHAPGRRLPQRHAAADAGAPDVPLCRGRLRPAVGHPAGGNPVWRVALRIQAGWKWNHKTMFSVLSWLTFAVLLLGRRVWLARPARG
jgi:hypothetical protein